MQTIPSLALPSLFRNAGLMLHQGDFIRGSTGDDELRGGVGDDTLDGGTGDDTLIGGAGDDIYLVDAIADVVQEAGGAGTDSVIVTVNGWVTPDHVEFIWLAGMAFLVTGGAAGEQIVANPVTGGAINGAGGDDTLWGSALTEYFLGGAGDDTIRGGGGADTMLGGTGDDQYIIDSTAAVVLENSGEGSDTAWVSVNGWVAPDHMEVIRLAGTAFFITGGGAGEQIVANPITGGAIDGGGGADTLSGTGLTEYFVGGAGDDVIRGGGGGDTMLGGVGDDQYIVDSTATVVIENAGEGTDAAWVSVNGWVAPGHIEIIRLAGTAFFITGGASGEQIFANPVTGGAINGAGGDDTLWGTGLTEYFVGGAGNDVFQGGGGADTLLGGAGDDQYVVLSADTVILENPGEGYDVGLYGVSGMTMAPNLEWASLIGNAASVTGNAQNNTIVGNSALDNVLLAGGAGHDTIYGGSGADLFRGDAGDDFLYSGGGADVFAYQGPGFGYDAISGFAQGAAKLDFRGSGIGFADVFLRSTNGNTQVEVQGDAVLVFGVASMTIGDFLF